MVISPGAHVHRAVENRLLTARRALMFALVLFWISPIALAVAASFRSPEFALTHPGQIWPPSLSLRAYYRLLSSGFLTWIVNSSITSITSTSVALFVAIPLGYAAGFRGGRLAGITVRLLLLTYLIPAIFLVFPILQFATTSGLRDSPAVVGILAGAFSAPLCSWLLKAQFSLVPRQLFEMAELDDLGIWTRVLHVVVPAAAPGVLAAGCLAFIVGWGEYTYSVALLPIASNYTVSVGIPHFLEGDIWSWDLLLPAICLSSIPPIGIGLLLTAILFRQQRTGSNEN